MPSVVYYSAVQPAIQGQHRKQPKIPSKLLHSFAPRGPIFVVAAACHQFKARNPAVKRIDFLSPAKRTENVNIWSSIRGALHREGYLKPPRVHVHTSCGNQADQLQRIVSELGGEVAQSADLADVSQIVYPFGPNGDPDDGVQYMRVQDRRGSDARVHWWYWPDSYDSWIPADQAPDVDDPDKPARGPRKVYIRWLLDSKKFNEWMNPVDYETEEYQAEQEAMDQNQSAAAKSGQADGTDAGAGSGNKRKFSPGGETGSRRAAARQRVDPGAGWHKAGPDQQLPPHVAWNQVSDTERRSLDGSASAENISRGQQRGPMRSNSYKLPQAAGPDPVSAGIPTAEADLSQELYKVPSHAAWFGYNAIHDIERKSVPDFFNGKAQSKTPKVYKEYRNFMINKHREDVKRRLTFTECRKLLAGDAMGVFRVWQFLDSWGIINYQAAAGAADDADGVPLTVQPAGPPSLLKVLAAQPNNGAALFKFTPPQATDGVAAAASGGLDGLNLITRRDRYGKSASQPSNNQVKYICNATGEDCSACRYHCTRMPDVDLSPAAYADGKFPPGCSSKDFTQPQDWSDEETLLLLEEAPVSSGRMRVAAATALGAAAVKAKMMADAEEREVQRQVQIAIEAQLQKVQLKLNSMTQLEDALERERSIMEAQRHQMLQARLGLQEQQMVVQKQAQQLHQATQRFPAALPGISAQAQSVAPAASAPQNSAVPAATPPAAQPGPSSAMQS
ncbi:MAG: SWI SNF complex subunit SMARCC2 isoform 2 [Trebouxia sp. A1-2]|nr:MAG: SWI SNF complex subunit SMARCC2 isoform 2 [Trebouxia sp. A1-2]